MSGALLGTVAGLALLDSLNPATIVTVALILILGARRPVLSALAVAAGAAATVFAFGAVVFLSAGAAADLVQGGIVWLRRLAFGLAAAALFVAAVRRLRARPRRAVALPAWFSPATALPLGIVVTGADLPNAFPYFIAIERLISARVPAGPGLAVLVGYAVVYTLPCLILLVASRLLHERVQPRIKRLFDRFTTGAVRRSVPMALGLASLGVVTASVAVTT
ncbi:MAG TPA: GAP family protein [Propionibacteriaceae bacterium]|nr:GAP family protein [Propionibacteriaceae bacterium]